MQKSKSTKIETARQLLFIALIALAPLSFTPSVGLSTHGFVSFRVGLYQVLAVLFCLVMVPTIWRQRRAILNDHWLSIPVAVLSILALISPFRSVDPARSALLCVSFGLLLVLILSGRAYMTNLNPRIIKRVVTGMLFVATAVCIYAITQLVIATFSKATHPVGLCSGCSATVFGFPRVNGFAAEPQFFANALIVPLITSFVLYFERGRVWLLALFSLIVLTITLTLSRGGYLAASMGLLTALILLTRVKLVSMKRLLATISCGLIAFVIALSLLVASARLHYPQTANITHDTFVTIVSQLSGGRIIIKKALVAPKPVNQTSPKDTQKTSASFKSPGVITASEKDRETAATHALRWWRNNVQTVLLGLGLGNLGSFAHQQDSSAYPLSFTVYIQYIFMLVELGIIGLLSFITLLLLGIKRTWEATQKSSLVALVLCSGLVAFVAQYTFFGTYINVVYTWLFIGMALGISQIKQPTRGAKHRLD